MLGYIIWLDDAREKEIALYSREDHTNPDEYTPSPVDIKHGLTV